MRLERWARQRLQGLAADLPNFGSDATYLGACVQYLQAFALPAIATACRKSPHEVRNIAAAAASSANRITHGREEATAVLQQGIASLTGRYSTRRLFVPFVAMQLAGALSKAASPEQRGPLIDAMAAVFRVMETHEALACPFEAELASDPTGNYARMTRQTQHDYRMRVEALADRMGQPADRIARERILEGALQRRNSDARP